MIRVALHTTLARSPSRVAGRARSLRHRFKSGDKAVRIVSGVACHGLRRYINAVATRAVACLWLHYVRPVIESGEATPLADRIERPPLNGKSVRRVALDAMTTAALTWRGRLKRLTQ